MVPKEIKKNDLWDDIRLRYQFPPQFLDLAKDATLHTMSSSFQTFKDNINKDYKKNGLTPFKNYGWITPNNWYSSVEGKTSSEA